MIEAFIRGLLAGYGIAIPVGAIALLIMDTGMRRGFRQGFAAGAGAATADFAYAVAAVGAGGIIVPLLAPIAPALRVLSGIVLVGLAVSGFLSLRRRRAAAGGNDGNARTGSTFGRFLALTLVNPLTVVYFAALVLAGSSVPASSSMLAAFAAGAFLASLSWQTLLAAVGTTMGIALPPAMRFATGAVGNLVILGFGVLTLARSAAAIL